MLNQRHYRRYYPILLGLFFFLYIAPLWARPVIVPDETRYAEIPREMIESGDWVTPRLNGLRYFEKPALAYWAVALSFRAFGENALAMRLPSALAVGISALLIWSLTSTFTGRRATGLLAAAAFITFLEVYGIGVFNVPDSLLAMFLTAGIVSYFRAVHQEDRSRRASHLILFGTFCGLAFLTKGFLAFVVPVVTIVPYMIWEKRIKDLFVHAWLPILAAAAVSLPWALAVAARESDYWPYFFWVEHIQRFMSDTPQHPEPFWYFIPVIIGGALPWVLLAPAASVGLKNTPGKTSLVRFALCWLLFPFLFFSASAGKLGTYILPCFPPLAILLAMGLQSYLESGKTKLVKAGIVVSGALAGLGAVGFVISQSGAIPDAAVYAPAEIWKWLLGALGLAVWAVLCLFSVRQKDTGKMLGLFCLSPALVLIIAHFILPYYSREDKAPASVLLRHQAEVKPNTVLISDEDMVSATCWFYKRDNVYLLEKGGELTYGLGYDDAKHRLVPIKDFGEFLERNRGKKVVAVLTKGWFERLKKEYGPPVKEDTDLGFTVAEYQAPVESQ